nr:MAG TPA: hypothetical protein [Caudoviricetes sp.]
MIPILLIFFAILKNISRTSDLSSWRSRYYSVAL